MISIQGAFHARQAAVKTLNSARLDEDAAECAALCCVPGSDVSHRSLKRHVETQETVRVAELIHDACDAAYHFLCLERDQKEEG